jgi:hypothetical protein
MTALFVVAGVCAVVVLIALRGLALSLRRGTVLCRLRAAGQQAWRSGVARYTGGELHWVPFWGLRLRPRHAIARRGLTVSSRRRLDSDEGPEGYWTVECRSAERPRVSLAMSEDALTGFLAWIESAPPSAHLDAA